MDKQKIGDLLSPPFPYHKEHKHSHCSQADSFLFLECCVSACVKPIHKELRSNQTKTLILFFFSNAQENCAPLYIKQIKKGLKKTLLTEARIRHTKIDPLGDQKQTTRSSLRLYQGRSQMNELPIFFFPHQQLCGLKIYLDCSHQNTFIPMIP
jgi:hypothetical protein